MTVSFYSAFWISTEVVYLQRFLVVTWLVPRETAAISARSIYTIQPCTMSLNLRKKLQKCKAQERMGAHIREISLRGVPSTFLIGASFWIHLLCSFLWGGETGRQTNWRTTQKPAVLPVVASPIKKQSPPQIWGGSGKRWGGGGGNRTNWDQLVGTVFWIFFCLKLNCI